MGHPVETLTDRMAESLHTHPIRLAHRPRIQVQTTHALRGFVLNDLGFAILPDVLVENELARGEVVRLLPDAQHVVIPVYAVYAHRQFMPLRTRAFIDYLKAQGNVFGPKPPADV